MGRAARGRVLLLAAACALANGCPITEWQQEVRKNWLCTAGCWNDEWCRHGCSHELSWEIPKGYYVARAWLTTAAYGAADVAVGYSDYEMAEAHHDLEGTETYGERRYGGERGGWLDETANAIEGRVLQPEPVRTYVDGAQVSGECAATEPRAANGDDSLLPDGFPAPRDYTSHPYTTPARTLERRPAPTAVRGAGAQFNIWNLCTDRLDITASLQSRVGPRVSVVLATSHTARGHGTRPGTDQNAGAQSYDKGTYRFKARATLFLHLSPQNSLKPYLGPAYGETHIKIAPPCLLESEVARQLQGRLSTPNSSNVSCVFTFGQVQLPKQGDVRLAAYPRGRVEVYKGGVWGSLCGHAWWDNEHGAANICKQLGYAGGGTRYTAGGVIIAVSGVSVGSPPPGAGAIVAGHRRCLGGEATIFDCALAPGRSAANEVEACTHDVDQGVACEGPRATPTSNAAATSHTRRGLSLVKNATLHQDGSVTCASPDMRGQQSGRTFLDGWRELRVWHQFNGSGVPGELPGVALSHALGFFVYSHAPTSRAVGGDTLQATTTDEVRNWRQSSGFSRRQGPALHYDYELPLRRRQDCPDPNDVDC